MWLIVCRRCWPGHMTLAAAAILYCQKHSLHRACLIVMTGKYTTCLRSDPDCACIPQLQKAPDTPQTHPTCRRCPG